MIDVELHALEVFGRHGVTEEERAKGQTLLYDVALEVADSALSDRLEDTVDYVAVAAYDRGATILRAHDVREHVEALTVAAAVAG